MQDLKKMKEEQKAAGAAAEAEAEEEEEEVDLVPATPMNYHLFSQWLLII